MKKVAGIMAVLLIIGVFSGCETTEGIGRDVKNAGEEIEDAAH